MVLAEHLTHNAGALLVWTAVEIVKFAHTIEYAAVNRLEAVSYVRQSTSHND